MIEKKVKTFEDLEVYNRSKEVTKEIYRITKLRILKEDYSLADQMRRASISVISNIAEGFERASKKEFSHFLNIAKGSNGELRAQVAIAFELQYMSKDDYEKISAELIAISKMLYSLSKYLKNE